jgi:2'-5' RNA ligase
LRKPADLDAFLSKHHAVSGPRTTLKELVLFKSDLTQGGAVYTRINGWLLEGRQDS